MRSLVVVALLVATVLAGCGDAGKKPTNGAEDEALDDLGLEATKDTGVVRGLVVDDAIRPLAGVTIRLSGEGGRVENVTNGLGAFGFDGLAPGTYFLTANKTGYNETQQAVDVVAGVADPAPVKVLLLRDAASLPYPVQYVMDGFMTCSARIALTAVPAGECQSSDVSQTTYDLDRQPAWGQSEMVWKSTQALGDALSLVFECFSGTASDPDPCPDGNLVVNRSEGSSPLVIMVNASLMQQFRIGEPDGNPYRLRVFAAGREDTDAIDEDSINGQLNSTTGGAYPCIAWPAINDGCFRFTGFGVILNQGFKIYTTVFYGYTPPEGWLFTTTGEVPQPPG